MFSFFSLLVSIVLFISSLFSPVYAGSLTNAKVIISDSRAGKTGVTHTFTFNTSTTGTIKTVQIQYCTTPAGACTIPDGIVTTVASQGTVGGLGTSTTDATTNGTFITTVNSPVSINAGTTITLPYNSITNPITINSSFFVRITSKDAIDVTIDSSNVAFAILDTTSLLVSADVGATFNVTVAAVTTGSVNGQTINLSTTTASSVPFGALTSGSSKVAAHDITVVSNSQNGYTIATRADSPPLVDGSNNIDNFTEPNSLPLVWTSPTGNTPNVNTGFIGYTTEDTSLCTGTTNRFSGNKWAGFSTTAYEVGCSTNSTTSGETTRIGWQIEVNGIQPSGSYLGTITLIITPVF